MMKKIAIILANEMNDTEIFVPLTIWKRAKLSVDLISVEKKNSIMTESSVKVGCNAIFETINFTQYHSIYIPGGPGVDRLLAPNWPVKSNIGPNKLFKTLETFRLEKNKSLLFTSESSKILAANMLIGNSRIAGFDKDYQRDESITEEIVVTKNLISVLGYWQLTEFALQVVEMLLGPKVRNEIEATIK